MSTDLPLWLSRLLILWTRKRGLIFAKIQISDNPRQGMKVQAVCLIPILEWQQSCQCKMIYCDHIMFDSEVCGKTLCSRGTTTEKISHKIVKDHRYNYCVKWQVVRLLHHSIATKVRPRCDPKQLFFSFAFVHKSMDIFFFLCNLDSQSSKVAWSSNHPTDWLDCNHSQWHHGWCCWYAASFGQGPWPLFRCQRSHENRLVNTILRWTIAYEVPSRMSRICFNGFNAPILDGNGSIEITHTISITEWKGPKRLRRCFWFMDLGYARFFDLRNMTIYQTVPSRSFLSRSGQCKSFSTQYTSTQRSRISRLCDRLDWLWSFG